MILLGRVYTRISRYNLHSSVNRDISDIKPISMELCPCVVPNVNITEEVQQLELASL